METLQTTQEYSDSRSSIIFCFYTTNKIAPIPPSFTKQYPIKGGHDDITLCVQRLLEEDVIERSHP
jgi:hypothetical protein